MGKKKVKSKKEDNILFNHIYQAGGIIRGPVNKGDFKTYLIPLVFFKRISDIYDEETQVAAEKYKGDEYMMKHPSNHRFVIPDGCHWEDVRQKTEDVGEALFSAFLKIESANEGVLDGIFTNFKGANWTNKNLLDDNRMKKLIEHISQIKLGNNDVDTDVIGKIYEFLMKKFADDAKKKAGEFYTPRPVIELMVKVLDPKPGEDIYDPACGTAGMLIEAFRHINNPQQTLGHLYGQENIMQTQSMGKINLYLHGAEEFEILQGDTLRKPLHLNPDGSLKTFDIVLANPPFSLENWGAEIWPRDKYGRCIFGTPPDNCGDYAWLQHMICSMKAGTGRMAVVMPQGVLFKENELRKALVESNKVWAVLQLANNMFYATTLAPCVLFLKNDKTDTNIRFIEGTEIFTKNVGRSFLDEEDIQRLYELITSESDVEEFARTVLLEEIKKNNYALSIQTYVKKKFVDNTPPFSVMAERVRQNEESIRKLESEIDKLIQEGE